MTPTINVLAYPALLFFTISGTEEDEDYEYYYEDEEEDGAR